MKKNNEVEVTVFTPTYNQEDFIETCIKGVLSQKTNFKFKYVISDDYSTDKTRKIIEKYKRKYPKIIETLDHGKNLGAMDNFVKSLNTIHTKYVALCDGDDFWTDENKLQMQYDALEQNKDCSICFHQTEIFYEDNSHDSVIYPVKVKKKTDLDDILKENYIVANTIMFRWKYLEEDSLIKEFPKNIVPGDYFLNIMHYSVGNGLFIKKVMSKYRKQPNGMWWLSSQPDKQDEFYLKYGKKLFNFYDAVEKKLKLPEEKLKQVKDWITWKNLNTYIRCRKYWEIKKLFFNQYFKRKHTFNVTYGEIGRKDKLFYCLSVSIFYLIYKILRSAASKIKTHKNN